jgi:hypothetical protein
MSSTASTPTAMEVLTRETDLPVQTLHFHKVDGYTTFSAEFAFEDNDIVFHFFQTAESRQGGERYWKEAFPAELEKVAMGFFAAGPPRLQATYVEDFELDSWWLRAFGFADVLDPDARARRFLALLDGALDAVIRT